MSDLAMFATVMGLLMVPVILLVALEWAITEGEDEDGTSSGGD